MTNLKKSELSLETQLRDLDERNAKRLEGDSTTTIALDELILETAYLLHYGLSQEEVGCVVDRLKSYAHEHYVSTLPSNNKSSKVSKKPSAPAKKNSHPTQLEYNILEHLINLGPAHAHQISTSNKQNLKRPSIYPAMRRMEKRGWLTSKLERPIEKYPERRTYSLTTIGKQVYEHESAWLQPKA
jgi:DNA-binding MarR family transcriptional regulator